MRLKIRDLREDRDISQKQIAQYLLCDQSLYSKYEREEREIPLRLLIKLAIYYNVSIDYLVGLTEVKKPYPRAQRHKPIVPISEPARRRKSPPSKSPTDK